LLLKNTIEFQDSIERMIPRQSGESQAGEKKNVKVSNLLCLAPQSCEGMYFQCLPKWRNTYCFKLNEVKRYLESDFGVCTLRSGWLVVA
jgi:hypothetical protein